MPKNRSECLNLSKKFQNQKLNNFLSPLRYPGGKGALGNLLANLIKENDLANKPYYELYAGGAGAALFLLFSNIVDRIHINDADYRIYAFWESLLNHTDAFIERIEKTPINIEVWKTQKAIYENIKSNSLLDIGFATFFLNRTSRSGILLKSGPIGGFQQNGTYTIDVRFNRDGLKNRIYDIVKYRERIILSNEKAENILTSGLIQKKSFTYLDPPYYSKGNKLYLNNYNKPDHLYLSDLLKSRKIDSWLVSYDNEDAIKQMYSCFRTSNFELNYSLQAKRQGSELLIFSDGLKLPPSLFFRKQELQLIEPLL
jgi:DNA adenine methylase